MKLRNWQLLPRIEDDEQDDYDTVPLTPLADPLAARHADDGATADVYAAHVERMQALGFEAYENADEDNDGTETDDDL